MEKPRSFSAKLINGAIAGVVGVSCTFPLDLAKTRLQDQRNLGPRKQYRNLMDCLWKVAKAEGAQGLYKGIGVNLLLINPEKAIKLAVNDQVRQMYGGKRRRLPLSKEMIAGGAAGFCQVIITTPMEMLKIQLQMAGTQNLADSPMTPNTTPAVAATSSNLRTFGTKSGTLQKSAAEIAQDVLRSKGVKGLYKGLGATLARDVPFSCIYFPLFSFLRLEVSTITSSSAPHILCLQFRRTKNICLLKFDLLKNCVAIHIFETRFFQNSRGSTTSDNPRNLRP